MYTCTIYKLFSKYIAKYSIFAEQKLVYIIYIIVKYIATWCTLCVLFICLLPAV